MLYDQPAYYSHLKIEEDLKAQPQETENELELEKKGTRVQAQAKKREGL